MDNGSLGGAGFALALPLSLLGVGDGKASAFGLRGGMAREAPELGAPGADLAVNRLWWRLVHLWNNLLNCGKERVKWSGTGHNGGASELYKLRLKFSEAPLKVSVRAPSLGIFNTEGIVDSCGGVVPQLKFTVILKAACSLKVFNGVGQMGWPDCVVHQRLFVETM
jgi:hypothetical protein